MVSRQGEQSHEAHAGLRRLTEDLVRLWMPGTGDRSTSESKVSTQGQNLEQAGLGSIKEDFQSRGVSIGNG